MQLLTRDEFRNGVFHRDKNLCVSCASPAQDAHHIIERRLFDNGGYYLGNGASLCGPCHIRAEQTTLSVETIRDYARIGSIVLPEHLYSDQVYDKWGNPVLANGRRIKGELFEDSSVQKILRSAPGIIELFDDYIKYPRTYHLPWSPGFTKDDRVLENTRNFEGRQVVLTTKMDGENTTLYHDYMHARSLDSEHHPSQTWVRNFHAKIRHDIPVGWRLCGENLYAEHSIPYSGLHSYFLLFAIYDSRNTCLNWEDTQCYAATLDIQTVPVAYIGDFCPLTIQKIGATIVGQGNEGYVLRLADEFPYAGFRKSVAKYVRKGHVATTHHWKRQMIKKNGLIDAHSS